MDLPRKLKENRLKELGEMMVARLEECRREQALLLDLSELELTSVPDSVFELEWLEHLNLGSNNLKFLPDRFMELPHLRILQVDGNLLTGLPPSVGQLKCLNFLDCSHNFMREMPDVLLEDSPLQSLFLYRNYIESLPPEIGGMSRLTFLQAESNRLTNLPERLPPQLVNLSVLRNRIEKIPD